MFDFEKAFSDFIEEDMYFDKVGNSIFDLVRAAFLSGWKAAGGKMPNEKATSILTLITKKSMKQ